jgi:putative endonuclease
MYYVYVLLSLRDHKFYIGFTSDLRRRIKEHNAGKNISTKARLPLKLFYYEAHLSKKDAERREQYFKTTKGKSTLRQMLRESLKEFCPTIKTLEIN